MKFELEFNTRTQRQWIRKRMQHVPAGTKVALLLASKGASRRHARNHESPGGCCARSVSHGRSAWHRGDDADIWRSLRIARNKLVLQLKCYLLSAFFFLFINQRPWPPDAFLGGLSLSVALAGLVLLGPLSVLSSFLGVQNMFSPRLAQNRFVS